MMIIIFGQSLWKINTHVLEHFSTLTSTFRGTAYIQYNLIGIEKTTLR